MWLAGEQPGVGHRDRTEEGGAPGGPEGLSWVLSELGPQDRFARGGGGGQTVGRTEAGRPMIGPVGLGVARTGWAVVVQDSRPPGLADGLEVTWRERRARNDW